MTEMPQTLGEALDTLAENSRFLQHSIVEKPENAQVTAIILTQLYEAAYGSLMVLVTIAENSDDEHIRESAEQIMQIYNQQEYNIQNRLETVTFAAALNDPEFDIWDAFNKDVSNG